MAKLCNKNQGAPFMFRIALLPFLTLAVIASATPAICQNRFADEAREKTERRAENKAVRELEHPEVAQTAATTGKEPAAPVQAAPAAAALAATAAPAQ
jgi:hypothetical protein